MVVEGVAAEGEEDLVPLASVGGGRRVEEDGDQGPDVLDAGGLKVMMERIMNCIPPNPRRVGYIDPIHVPLYMG